VRGSLLLRYAYAAVIAASLIAVVPSAALAQAAPASIWEVEVHGGGLIPTNPTGGTAGTIPSAAPFTTVVNRPSSRVSSWFFGPGAQLFNQLPVLLAPNQITALDPVLDGSTADYQSGGDFGFRISRRLTGRLSAEFNFDYANTPLEITSSTLDAIEASRASFERAFTGLSQSGAFFSPSIRATTTGDHSGGREFITTGAVTVDLATHGGLVPYVTAGAGVASSGGDLPDLTLTGSYSFSLVGILPIAETDTVRLHYSTGSTFVALFGGGVKRDMSPRWGLRGDARVNVGGNPTKLLLDATPNVAVLTPPLAIASVTTPSVQFANNPVTNAPSTLSGPAITNFEAFKGGGTRAHVALTGGVYWRF